MPADSEPPLCKVCKSAPIAGCRNTLEYPSGGAILVHRGEDLVSVPCPNMRVMSLRQRLLSIDGQFLKVEHDAATPLYQTGQFDRTEDDLFIRAVYWKTFLRHFKWVIASKSMGFFVRIASDMTLLNVFVGNTNIKNRLPSQRTEDGDVLISNSLEDLLASPDLAIIRLGQIAHGNRAAANVLRQAITLRAGAGKPTWLVEPPDQAFRPWVKLDHGGTIGMPCCDDDVFRMVNDTFDEIHLSPGETEPAPSYEETEDGVTLRGSSEGEEFEPAPETSDEPADAREGRDEPDDREVDALINRRRKSGFNRTPHKRRT